MSHNTWAHRLVAVGVRPLARTGVTPNQVTTLRLVTGLAAAAAFASGMPVWMAVGGGVYILSMLLDRADGMLARLTGKTSHWGHVYDLIADYTVTALLFVSIGIGLRGGGFGDAAIAMGLVAGTAVTIIFVMVQKIEAQLPKAGSAVPTAAGFDPDDTLFVVGPLAWLGWLEPFLLAAAVGAPVAAVITVIIYRARRRPEGARSQRRKTSVGIE